MPPTVLPALPGRRVVAPVAFALMALAQDTLHAAAAQADFPSRPVRLIVPFAPGGGTDFVARVFAQKLGEAFGQQVVVDNRPGASAILGADIVARAQPDGYTLLIGTGTFGNQPIMFRKLPYDPVRDFAPVSLLARSPLMLSAHPTLPAGSVQELVALAKARPGQIAWASFGVGAFSHLTGELFRLSAGIDLLNVQYKGAGDALSNVLAGQVPLMFSSPPAVLPQYRVGKLKGLAVTGVRRQRGAADIPTFAETGFPAVDATDWYGILAPSGTPPATIARLQATIARVAVLPDLAERLASTQFAEAMSSTPAELRDFMAAERARWARVVREAKIRVE